MEDELGEWLQECTEEYNRMLPIQQLEFREELERLAFEGRVIIVHGRKSDCKTYLIDRLKEGNTDDTKTPL